MPEIIVRSAEVGPDHDEITYYYIGRDDRPGVIDLFAVVNALPWPLMPVNDLYKDHYLYKDPHGHCIQWYPVSYGDGQRGEIYIRSGLYDCRSIGGILSRAAEWYHNEYEIYHMTPEEERECRHLHTDFRRIGEEICRKCGINVATTSGLRLSGNKWNVN